MDVFQGDVNENDESNQVEAPVDDRLREKGNAGRCTKDNSKRKYSKKRRWHGKTQGKLPVAGESKKRPISYKKVKYIKKPKVRSIEGFRLLDMDILHDILNSVSCPECFETGTLTLEEDLLLKKGLANFWRIRCDECQYSKETYTSKVTERNINNGVSSIGGTQPFEVNIRSVYASRGIGVDHRGLEQFCGMMNLPKPVTVNNHKKISDALRDAAKLIAERSMCAASVDLRSKHPPEMVADVGVSMDGTWQKRGFTSLNGVMVCISIDSGKIIDVEPMSRYCRQCSVMTRSLEGATLDVWKANHAETCTLNHEGSAPAMEPVGAKRIFERSIEKHQLRYTGFYGDGDSKGFASVENVYDGVKVVKYECVGHYQKRVGTRLRKLKKRVSGLKELTETVIDRLQNYFGIALRANTSSVPSMARALLGSFFHVASSENRNLHTYCDDGPNSWCQYKRDVANNTNLYKPSSGLSDLVITHVKPIYQDLTKPAELKKCLHGKTQNQNESFNAMIWARAPKSRYCGVDKIQFAVYDAVANFNDGRQASLDILQNMGVVPGYFTTAACRTLNIKRKRSASAHSTAKWRKSRKMIRAQKKRKGDVNKKKEGTVYKTGGF